jgi:hypothetical protein
MTVMTVNDLLVMATMVVVVAGIAGYIVGSWPGRSGFSTYRFFRNDMMEGWVDVDEGGVAVSWWKGDKKAPFYSGYIRPGYETLAFYYDESGKRKIIFDLMQIKDDMNIVPKRGLAYECP